MPVDVVDSGGAAAALLSSAQRAGDALLDCLALSGCELCVVLVTDSHMRELNAEWRGKDAPTDVLSFSQSEDNAVSPGGTRMLGDVVVSVDTLKRQAQAGGWTDEEELARLVLHGLLHLLGHDHESEDEARQMRAEESRLVGLLRGRGISCASGESAS